MPALAQAGVHFACRVIVRNADEDGSDLSELSDTFSPFPFPLFRGIIPLFPFKMGIRRIMNFGEAMGIS
jgi:hypothetical protein